MSELWGVTIWLGSEGSRQIGLMFDSEDKAREVYVLFDPNSIDETAGTVHMVAEDDYGTTIACDPRDIIARMLQNVRRHFDIQVELAVLQVQGQQRAQQKVQGSVVQAPLWGGLSGQGIGWHG